MTIDVKAESALATRLVPGLHPARPRRPTLQGASVTSKSTPLSAPFSTWLRARVNGRRIAELAVTWKVGESTIHRALAGERPSERFARAVASGNGADPDEIAVLAGYADVRGAGLNPDLFASLSTWFGATLNRRRETEYHAAIHAGLSGPMGHRILYDGEVPRPPILDKLAGYFRVDRYALRALAARSTTQRRSIVTQPVEALPPFPAWLLERVECDGRSIPAIERAAGISENAIYRVLKGEIGKLREGAVRALARTLGDDPNRVAALAGYPDVTARAPSPLGFVTLREWLKAALQARNESPCHAARAMGLCPDVLYRVLRGQGFTRKRTLRNLAGYLEVDVDQLLARRLRNPRRASSAKIAFEANPGRLREFARLARAARDQASPDERKAWSREGGKVAWARMTIAERTARQRDMADSAMLAMRERGDWYRSPESRTQAVQKFLRIGATRAREATVTAIARHGPGYFSEKAKIGAAKTRNGRFRPCLFCGDPERLIYVTPSRECRGGGSYHWECYRRWRRTQPMRELSRTYGQLGWIWRQVSSSDDEELKARVQAAMQSELGRIRDPSRSGRPTTLLKDLDLVLELARRHYIDRVPALDLYRELGWRLAQDSYGQPAAGSKLLRLLRFGRSLLRLQRLESGRRRTNTMSKTS